MNKPKPVVGQTLWVVNVGDDSRHKPSVAVPTIVRSVGRKYFACSTAGAPNYETEFHLGTWAEKTEYSRRKELYATEQEWLDERESKALEERIRTMFQPSFYKGVPSIELEDLRKIEAILSTYPTR